MKWRFFSALLFITASAFAQSQADDQVAARENLIAAYKAAAGGESRLYNGIRRTPYDVKMLGTAFFPDSLTRGWVYYDSVTFDNVPLQFDLYRQEVLVGHYLGFKYTLLPERTLAFSVKGHHFVRHDPGPLNKNAVPPGFYDHLYEGPSSVIAHRFVFITQKVEDEIIRTFVPKTEYFVRHNGVFVPCNNRKTVRRLLGKSARPTQRYLQSKKIRFKKHFETALIESFKFLDNQR